MNNLPSGGEDCGTQSIPRTPWEEAKGHLECFLPILPLLKSLNKLKKKKQFNHIILHCLSLKTEKKRLQLQKKKERCRAFVTCVNQVKNFVIV